MFEEREKIQRKITGQISSSVIDELKEYRWKRFCDAGEKSRRGGNRDEALEYFSLCLEMTGNQQGTAKESASALFAEFVGVSEQVLKKYSMVEENEDDRWPYGPAALSDSEISRIGR
ncbi:MAG: hypothetical protein U9R74_04865 [Pseudomonadota bacterium]|nr:hypothetical protein [Pseudomonadota bacterium]